jgi:hypothetical protein
MRYLVIAAAGALAAPVLAQHGQPLPAVPLAQANDPYRPFEFLVGEWVSQEGSSTLRQKIGWGPERAFMTYSTTMQQPGKPERLHFGGIMAWNGKTKKLDFLFGVEPGSWILERGSVHAQADGTIVRDVELIAPTGATSIFRQTIRRVDDNTAITSLMALRDDGKWEPNFPGSERIEMKRRD